jgi:hypothetical protein
MKKIISIFLVSLLLLAVPLISLTKVAKGDKATCSYLDTDWTACDKDDLQTMEQGVCLTINPGETECSSCGTRIIKRKCSAAVPPIEEDVSSSPSGGRGDGGSNCVEDWECSFWNDCVDSQQIRTCTDLNECDTILSKPAEDLACSIPLVDEEEKVVEGAEEETTGLGAITGAVIGGGTTTYLSILVVLALIGGTYFLVKAKSKKIKK